MLFIKALEKGRHHLPADDKPRQAKPSRVYAEREKEPWLLATSLITKTAKYAKKIVKLYRSRMQIEESFRDLKTGLNFNESNTRTQEYLSVLLLLAMLAQYVLFLLGMTVKLSNKHLRDQANSLKTGQILSYQFIGLRAFKDRGLKLTQSNWKAAKLKIQ